MRLANEARIRRHLETLAEDRHRMYPSENLGLAKTELQESTSADVGGV